MKERNIFTELKIDHFAFLCKDFSTSTYLSFYRQLSWDVFHEEQVSSEGVNLKLLKSNKENFYIELISPLNTSSSLNKTLAKRGESFHHICYKVHKIEDTIKDLNTKNINTLPNYPRIGSRNKRICFLNPKDTGGILIELAECTDLD